MSHASYTMQHGDSTSFLHGIPTCRKTLRYFKNTCFLRATLNMFFWWFGLLFYWKSTDIRLGIFWKTPGPRSSYFWLVRTRHNNKNFPRTPAPPLHTVFWRTFLGFLATLQKKQCFLRATLTPGGSLLERNKDWEDCFFPRLSDFLVVRIFRNSHIFLRK